ncbi:hypothetical protein D3C87_919790 [compost metagenome]
MPHHTGLARPRFDLLTVGGALLKHLQHALVSILRGNNRGAHRLAHRVKLVIARNLLDDGVAILLEQYEVAHVIQEQFGLEETANHCFQLHLQTRPVIFVGDGAPGQHALRVRGERADACSPAIAHHQGGVAVEQVANLVLVGLQLVEGIPHVGLLVGGVFQLHHGQRQTVHEGDQVWSARLPAASDGELVYHQKVIVAGLGKVDEVDQIGLFLVASHKLHQQAIQKQAMHAAVAHHHLQLAHRLQSMRRLLQGRRRDLRVDPGQCGHQALAQHHLPVIGALRGAAIRRYIRAVGETPAGLLKPAPTQFFELLFVQHEKILCVTSTASVFMA